MFSESLWGEDFVVPDKKQTEDILNKIKNPKKVSTKKKISSKLSLKDKFAIIEENVYKILGKFKDDTLVIKTKEQLVEYIDKVIENKILSLDTETNNSLDPITCKLMGPCLYTPGMKQAYVPINHVNPETEERLSWQLTEEDVREQFARIPNDVDIIYHNAQFDIRVIQCTSGIEMNYAWDTLIASQLLNENEEASLKKQYIRHIDPNLEKYSIEGLFEKERYELFSPDLFALYAATDARMTYELYLYQKKEFEKEENKNVYKLYKEVELPCIRVVKDMELTGVTVDLDYAKRLQNKYHKIIEDYDDKIQVELDKLLPKIEAWKLSKEASSKDKDYFTISDGQGFSTYGPIKSKELNSSWHNTYTPYDVVLKESKKYPLEDEIGMFRYKKSKTEKLTNPINLNSSTQMAIILYDILGAPIVNKKTPRSTDKNTLPLILEKMEIPFLKIFIEKKEFETLVNNFIDKIPTLVNPKTGRIHCSFNQTGTVTGRFSCSDPNLQQIPSHNKEIRLMFTACTKEEDVEEEDNKFEVSNLSEVMTKEGWKLAKELQVNDIICGDDWQEVVKNIDFNENKVYIYI